MKSPTSSTKNNNTDAPKPLRLICVGVKPVHEVMSAVRKPNYADMILFGVSMGFILEGIIYGDMNFLGRALG